MSDVLLTVEGLNAHYGSAHVLQDVSFELGEQAVAIIGRNGMGKSTLCAAIMGIRPPRASGSVRFAGKELVGMSSHRIANRGSATSRRAGGCFRRSRSTSTCGCRHAERRATVDDRAVSTSCFRAWPSGSGTAARSSRAASSRCSRSGARCYQPEALDHGRAVRGARADDHREAGRDVQELEEEGLRLLLIEQNLGVATALAERQLVMVAGAIAAETTATQLGTIPSCSAATSASSRSRGSSPCVG